MLRLFRNRSLRHAGTRTFYLAALYGPIRGFRFGERLFGSRIEIFILAFIVLSSCNKSTSPSPKEEHVIAPSIQLIDIADDKSDQSNYDDSEPSIAVNPKNPKEIAVVAFSGSWGEDIQAPIWKSRDGGASWKKILQIPQPASGLWGPGDQKIAFDADGRIYVTELGESRTNNDVAEDFLFRQTAGPDDPLTPSKQYGDDQPHLSADIYSSGCRNALYSSWLKTQSAQTLDRSMDSATGDGGKHLLDTGVGDNKQFPNRTSRIAVARDGKAFMVYKVREGQVNSTFETVHFMVKRTDDCGKSWNGLGGSSGVSILGTNTAVTFFTDSFGNHAKGKVACARSSDDWIATSSQPGEVYIAYVNRDNSGFAQIYIARSVNLGNSWTSIRATDGTHNSAYPEIAITDAGVVGLMYIDYDDAGARTVFRHMFALSLDRGSTWNKSIILQDIDPSGISNASDGILWGDYEGLTSLGNTFYGIFTGQSINRAQVQLDPIFFKLQMP